MGTFFGADDRTNNGVNYVRKDNVTIGRRSLGTDV